MCRLVSPLSLPFWQRSEEHTSELQSRLHLVCRLLLEKKKNAGPNRTRLSAPTTTRHTSPAASRRPDRTSVTTPLLHATARSTRPKPSRTWRRISHVQD